MKSSLNTKPEKRQEIRTKTKSLREIKEEEINRNYTFSNWIYGGRKVIDTLNTCNLRELRLS